jgi:hypothetical protein
MEFTIDKDVLLVAVIAYAIIRIVLGIFGHA